MFVKCFEWEAGHGSSRLSNDTSDASRNRSETFPPLYQMPPSIVTRSSLACPRRYFDNTYPFTKRSRPEIDRSLGVLGGGHVGDERASEKRTCKGHVVPSCPQYLPLFHGPMSRLYVLPFRWRNEICLNSPKLCPRRRP